MIPVSKRLQTIIIVIIYFQVQYFQVKFIAFSVFYKTIWNGLYSLYILFVVLMGIPQANGPFTTHIGLRHTPKTLRKKCVFTWVSQLYHG